MWLFGPAWKTSNPNKAYKGILYVQKVSDDKELFEIATNAQLEEVAEAALERIQDHELLIRLIKAGKGGPRVSLAADPETPASELAQLAVDAPEDVRAKVAGNPSTPAATLADLAKDESARVCRQVAANPSTSVAALVNLSKHHDQFVRAEVVDNPSTPVSALRSLSRDGQPIIRMKVAQNPKVPRDVLEALCHDADENVREDIVLHVATIPPSVLADMASTEMYSLRCAIARHPMTPLFTLEELARDDAERVQTLANEELCKRLGHDLDKHCMCRRCGAKVDHVFTHRDKLVEGDTCARCGGRIVKVEWHSHPFDDSRYREGVLRFSDGSTENLNDYDDEIHRHRY